MSRLVLSAVIAGTLTAGAAFADWDNNAGFETPYTNAWYSFDPGVTTNSTLFARTGLSSMEFATPDFTPDDVPGGNLPSYTLVDWPYNAASEGETWTATAYYRVDQALENHERLGIGIFWIDATGAIVDPDNNPINNWTTVFGPEVSTGGSNFPIGNEVVGAWTPIQITSTAPAGTAYMQVALEVAGSGSAIYYDDIEVIPEPASILLVGMGLIVVAVTRRKRL